MDRSRNPFWIYVIPGLLLSLALIYYDAGEMDHFDLRKAMQVVRYLCAERQLARSTFMVLDYGHAGKRPSDLVEWLFSELGRAEWPPPEKGAGFYPDEMQAMRRLGMPFMPEGVRLVPGQPDISWQKQVVVKADDVRYKIIVSAYTDPRQQPVLVQELDFPKNLDARKRAGK